LTLPAGLTAGAYYYYCMVSATGADPVTSNVSTVIVNASSTVMPVPALTPGALAALGLLLVALAFVALRRSGKQADA
jgi:hypothetical protein